MYSIRKAALWTAFWVSSALVFAGGLWLLFSPRIALEFMAGYVVEESLSIDNMFVFALVFRYFGVRLEDQRRVLFWGVLGAIVFRGIFVIIGSALVRFEWVLVIFGLFLIFTGIKMALGREKEIHPEKSLIVKWAKRWLPITRRHPILIVLLVLETTDIVFAVDSVPAVFGVTREPLVVYTSNIFAVLGLRSMYFLLAGALDRFHALNYGLAAVLIFVGLKMVWLDHLFGGRFPIGISLAIIGALVGGSIAASFVFPKRATSQPRD